MDSEQSAAVAANQRHHKYMTCINPQSQMKKQRYIEVFQCSIDDMNLVLTGGVPVSTRQLLSPGTNSALLTPGSAPYGAPFPPPPYLQSPQHPQVLPGAASSAALSPAAARVPNYYPHPLIYWPYPSPPVSPTAAYYAHSSATLVSSAMHAV